MTRMPALPTMSRPGSNRKRTGRCPSRLPDDRRVAVGVVGLEVLAGAVGDAEPAAEVDVVDVVAVGRELVEEAGEDGEGGVERGEVGDLRADVHVDAGDLDAGQGGRLAVDGAGARDRDAELRLGLAGGDLGVGQRVDVRVDPQADRRDPAALGRDAGDHRQLGLGFDVEAEDGLVEGKRDLGRALADAGEGDACSPGTPAARARRSSPSETTSMPAPSRASRVSTAWLELALTAKQTSASSPSRAWAKTR